VQQLPASADAFVWLRLYQLEMDGKLPRGSGQPLWWTLRRPFRPLAYHAAHRMFERAGAAAGTDWPPQLVGDRRNFFRTSQDQQNSFLEIVDTRSQAAHRRDATALVREQDHSTQPASGQSRALEYHVAF
jgi:hypothetical protein